MSSPVRPSRVATRHFGPWRILFRPEGQGLWVFITGRAMARPARRPGLPTLPGPDFGAFRTGVIPAIFRGSDWQLVDSRW